MKIKNTTIISREKQLLIDEIDQEIVVFNEKTQNTHILNEIAGFILKHAENITFLDLVKLTYDNLSDEDHNNLALDEIYNDCAEFINHLYENHLIILENND